MSSKLLAGPIVRRATKNRVCVWLATRQSIKIKLEILDQNQQVLASSNAEEIATTYCAIGKNLHVYLLQARAPSQGFPQDCLLQYRLVELDSSNDELVWDLRNLGLTYANEENPSFVIADKLSKILHGSCRKPHGCDYQHHDRLDALRFGDDLLNTHYHDPNQRPSLLILSGDQIYADDVAVPLLAMLRGKAAGLMGYEELLPNQINPAQIRLGSRKTILSENKSGFTSDKSHNHLLSFGEFAAMYLYILGNRDGWQPEFDWGVLQKSGFDDVGKASKVFEAELAPLQRFHATLPQIRRLLANIATYMIFDDHEVTDDWNINGAWYEKVRDSALGRRIVSNALAAYWAFQGWGNDPDNFDKDLIYSITKQLNSVQNNAEVSDRFDLYLWKHRNWGFSVPTDPPIIAVDARTQRQPDHGNHDYYPPRLMDRYALDWLRVEWAKLKADLNLTAEVCPIIVVSMPVMGFTVLESIKHMAVWLASAFERIKQVHAVEKAFQIEGVLTGFLVKTLDAEISKDGYAEFLMTLIEKMKIQRCVFLSGDVHHSFSAIAWFRYGNKYLDCYQLTSSAFCNQPHKLNMKLIDKIERQKIYTTFLSSWPIRPEWIRDWAIKPLWESQMQLLPAEYSETRIQKQCNLGLVVFHNGIPENHTLVNGEVTSPNYELSRFPLLNRKE